MIASSTRCGGDYNNVVVAVDGIEWDEKMGRVR